MTREKSIGLLGARSLVGKHLVPLLIEQEFSIHAITRSQQQQTSGVTWYNVHSITNWPKSSLWISMIPIWVLPSYFSALEKAGIQRLIAFSSTSRLVKIDSSDASERKLAETLAEAEEKISAWATKHNIKYTILRPTLIYDEGKDKNISMIASFIRKFGFFPVVGNGSGLRTPVYAGDLATAVMQILNLPDTKTPYYNLSGGESLTYNDMVARIFKAMHRNPRILHVPAMLLVYAIRCARILPRFKHWTTGIAVRMQKDQVFSSEDAIQDFAYNPRAFYPILK